MMIIGIITAILSAASWAMGAILFNKIGKFIPASGTTFIKGVLSLLLLLLIILFVGLEKVDLNMLIMLALCGVLGIAIGDTLFFTSLQALGPKIQVLFLVLGQVVVMLLSYVFLNEVHSQIQYFGAIVVIIGVIIVIWDKQSKTSTRLKGIITGCLSIICFSVSIIIVKTVLSEVSVLTVTFYRLLFGTVSIFVFGALQWKLRNWIAPLKDTKLLLLLFIAVVIITYGGFLLSTLSIKYIDVSIASILYSTEPIFVFLFANFINKEAISKKELAGATVTLIGVFLVL